MFAELFSPEQIAILTQIILIDLVLAGDNAIIIGMVASKFPVDQRKKIIFWGIGGAVILRIILTLLTAYLLQITGLRLIGGLLLLYIVYKLYVDVIKGSEKEEDINVDSSNLHNSQINYDSQIIKLKSQEPLKSELVDFLSAIVTIDTPNGSEKYGNSFDSIENIFIIK